MNTMAEILSSRGRESIFRLLFGVTGTPLHTREIQRRSSVTLGAVQQELRKLVRLGLITGNRDGNRVVYRANREHPLFVEIHHMVLKTSGLADVLREALNDPGIRWAFVFGSIASGEEKAGSDIDLMVIGDIGLRRLSGMLSGATEKVGREINPHVFTEREFLRRKRAREHFVTRVLESPRLIIVGDGREFAAMAR
jgi:predicted nucleotidyltransferase